MRRRVPVELPKWHADFLKLVTDGKPIADRCREPCSHNAAELDEDARRKTEFLKLGRRVFEELGRRVSAGLPGPFSTTTNRAGAIVSGDIVLIGPGYWMLGTHHAERFSWGDVTVNVRKHDRVSAWLKWEDLQDLDWCARVIHRAIKSPRPLTLAETRMA